MHTVVILHGWGQDSGSWKNAFAGYHDVRSIVFDLPGFGKEPLPLGGETWGIPEYAAWVQNKIGKENLHDAILLGHSFGGRIAAHIASTQPPWLSGLILYGVPCLYRPKISIRLKRQLAHVIRAVGYRGAYRGNPEFNEAKEKGLGGAYRRVVNYDQTEELKKIAAPTLILWGEKDIEIPIAIGKGMQQLIPKNQLVTLPGLGHNAHIENPTLFYGVAKKFIEGL